MLIMISVKLCASPQWEEIEPLYQISWADNLTLNLKKLNTEFNDNSTGSSARFTYESTAKTPFISRLISSLSDYQIELTRESIENKTKSAIQTTIFGIVVRGTPDEITEQHWDKNESFGWAYSFSDAKEICAEIFEINDKVSEED